ncbi:NADP-dependent oxidoreductase domain [Phytophthora cactorum]|nr:NADP-dependent oxidoreductase domain [Phytophthora cactorum]
MSAFVQSKLLPSWYSIPSLALGVFQSNPGAEAYNAVLTALKLGYRHIDTATFYKNERDVGRAIRDSGISREEIFVTSKYFETSRWSYQRVAEGVRESNRKLGLGSIDLYLLHAPSESLPVQRHGVHSRTCRPKGSCVTLVSPASVRSLSCQSPRASSRQPAVNQVELHPRFARRETDKLCEDQGIVMEANSTLAFGEGIAYQELPRFCQTEAIGRAKWQSWTIWMSTSSVVGTRSSSTRFRSGHLLSIVG